ncbi:hypothetical protein FQN49_000101 [Arthroderma sp. PD_2]|nr:hypothetical protein FQN49_000101 [Arthroderma sp. PD_2]
MSGDSTNKPSVLVVGGLGFIGRHLVHHIHKNNLASELRVVDKLLPQLAWLSPEITEACKDRFVQADASREQSLPRVFDRENGAQFDLVINCGGESRYSHPDDVYRLRSHALSVSLGKEAARRGIKAFVECSSAAIYKFDEKPRKESDKLKPIQKLTKWKVTTEEELGKIEGLNLVILRFPYVYGAYDTGLLTSVICVGRTYKEIGRPLTFLYAKERPLNTVWVEDAARALWTAATWRASKGPLPPNQDPPAFPTVFNIVDHNNTLKGDLADALERNFGIKCEFLGSLMSQFAKMNQEQILDEMNEETLEVWSELLQAKGITTSGPISPFLEKEVLKDTDTTIDGSLFEQTTGFTYLKEKLDPDWLSSVIKSYEQMNWWP